MKITSAKVMLTEEDLFGIIEDYVKVEGLNINEISINNIITVTGIYKKSIEMPFNVQFGIGNVHDNILNIKIFDIKVRKIGLFSAARNLTIKAFLKRFQEYGFKADKDMISVDLDLVSKLIPYVYFKLKKVKIVENGIEAEVDDLIYAKNKEVVTLKKDKEKFISIKDKYSKLRENIGSKVPGKFSQIVQYALLIPDIIALLYRLFRDSRVNVKTKVLVGGILAYAVSPLDILPDFIPFIGKIDDIAILFFGLNQIINEVPENVILENWQGKDNIIIIVREAVNYISKAVGAQNVGKLVDTIRSIMKKSEEKAEASKTEDSLDTQEIAVSKE